MTTKKGPNNWKKEWDSKFKELLRKGVNDIDDIKKPTLEVIRAKYFPTYRYDLFQAKVRRAAGKERVERETAGKRKTKSFGKKKVSLQFNKQSLSCR
jgi:hypothetical protein